MSTQVFDPVAYSTAILALLNGVSGLTVYDGEVPADPPADAAGRVNAYAVLYPGAGVTAQSSLAGASTVAQWPFQVTVAGGDRQRCSWAAWKVATALVDVRPTVANWSSSRIRQVPGPDMRRDDVEQPPRFYVPLLFTLTATPA